jgi:hypothetical protein
MFSDAGNRGQLKLINCTSVQFWRLTVLLCRKLAPTVVCSTPAADIGLNCSAEINCTILQVTSAEQVGPMSAAGVEHSHCWAYYSMSKLTKQHQRLIPIATTS